MSGGHEIPCTGNRRSGGGWRVAVAASAAILAFELPARADEPSSLGREVWAGADVSSNVWLVYSGVTFAPWGAIHQDGWRFRTAGGYGQYEYDRTAEEEDTDPNRALNFEAETYFAEVLVGYQKRFGELTAKAFVGVSTISHDISPTDDENIAIGDEIGVKGAIELWLNIGERGWASLDLSWASAHDTRAARTRIGYRVWPKLSVGFEGGINVDSQGECRVQAEKSGRCGYLKVNDDGSVERAFEGADLLDYARLGSFVRYEWGVSEASISAGVLGDSFASDGAVELAPYVTLNWLTQF